MSDRGLWLCILPIGMIYLLPFCLYKLHDFTDPWDHAQHKGIPFTQIQIKVGSARLG